MNTSWALLRVGTTQGHMNPLLHTPSPQQQRDVSIPAGIRVSEKNLPRIGTQRRRRQCQIWPLFPLITLCRDTSFAEQMNGTGKEVTTFSKEQRGGRNAGRILPIALGGGQEAKASRRRWGWAEPWGGWAWRASAGVGWACRKGQLSAFSDQTPP